MNVTFQEDQFAMVLLMVQKYSQQKEGEIYFVFYVLKNGINTLVDGVWHRYIVDENGNHKAQLQLKNNG